MTNLLTALFAIWLGGCGMVISSSISEPGTSIKTWTSYDTLPEGVSGAMIAYNETSKTISILSPENPWGHAYLTYNVDSDNFTTKHYPSGKPLAEQVTNDFVQIGDNIYFINTFPAEQNKAYTMQKFSLITEEYTTLNGSLANHVFTEAPCLTKSNDNKYIFYLGGSDSSAYYDTFAIYDVTHNRLAALGPKLPYPAMQMGCLVTSDDYLYVIGGKYTPKPKTAPYVHIISNEIWSIYVGDIDNMMNAQWTVSSKTLPYYPQLPFLADVNDLLYVIGGYTDSNYTCSDEVNYLQFKNGTNGTNAARNFDIIPGPLLPEPLCYPAGIMADYEIYLFGGQNASDDDPSSYALKRTWMKSNYAGAPTPSPTQSPTNAPTQSPTVPPSMSPTNSPTASTLSPTASPTNSPTQSPTTPTLPPTLSPTNSPTNSPSNSPTHSPTKPTVQPTPQPTPSPTHSPTNSPTKSPSATPTNSPTAAPTNASTTASPTKAPTHGGSASSGGKHTTEYWVFMILLISVSVLLLLAAGVWFFKRWRDNKRERMMFEQDA